MSVSVFRLLDQGPVLRTLAGVALAEIRPKHADSAARELPGPWFRATLPPRPDALVRDYVRNVGGDPAWYRGRVPAHLFPQWGFPLAAKAIAGMHYPMARVINAGCRIEMNAPLPAGEPLEVAARLESVDDDGHRALIATKIVTGTASAPEAVVATLHAYVPLSRGSQSKSKPRFTVPLDAHEIAFFRIGDNAGWEFAKLTGDLNPIHWIKPAAKASGFRSVILHGFATLARAVEAVNRDVLAGDVNALASVDARFTKPLVLPAKVGVYVTHPGALYVADAPGAPAYLEGTFTRRTP